MVYTSDKHLGTKLVFVLAWAVSLVLVAYLVSLIYPLLGFSKDYEIFPDLVLWIPITVLMIRLMDKYANDWAAYRYINKDLDTPVTRDAARRLSFLFCENADGKWYPMKQVKALPKEQRKQYLFNFAAELAERSRSGKLIT